LKVYIHAMIWEGEEWDSVVFDYYVVIF